LLLLLLLLLFVTATPKSIQSMAYLLRNEILDNINNLRAELQYQISTRTETNQPNDHSEDDNEDNDDDDVSRYAQAAYTAMQRYMEIIPPTEIQRAETLRDAI
jgi:3'-phosphoadenosine 5'-phosphosulfate sulfotransferase